MGARPSPRPSRCGRSTSSSHRRRRDRRTRHRSFGPRVPGNVGSSRKPLRVRRAAVGPVHGPRRRAPGSSPSGRSAKVPTNRSVQPSPFTSPRPPRARACRGAARPTPSPRWRRANRCRRRASPSSGPRDSSSFGVVSRAHGGARNERTRPAPATPDAHTDRGGHGRDGRRAQTSTATSRQERSTTASTTSPQGLSAFVPAFNPT